MGVAIRTTSVEEIVAEITRLHESLPPRPTLEEVEAALVEGERADLAFSSRLEELSKQRRSDDVPPMVFDSFKELKKDVLQEQARERKRAAEAVIMVEERHRRFDGLIQRVYSALADSPDLLHGSDKNFEVNKVASVPPGLKPNRDAQSWMATPETSAIASQDWQLDSIRSFDSSPFTASSGDVQSELKSPYPVLLESFDTVDLTSVLRRSSSTGGFVPNITQHQLPNSEAVLTPDIGIASQAPSKVLIVLNMAMTTKLKNLDLHGAFLHQLEWVPESVGQLTWLTELNLSGNRLATIPESIRELHNLITLDLSTNLLTALPDSLGCLTSLETLNIENNKIEELPWTIGQCTALVELNANFNKLKALPEAVGNLRHLHILSVHLNCLRSLPTSMASMTSLRELDAHFNELNSVPESLCLVTGLVKLNIASNFNDLKKLPLLIGKLQSLKELDASCNHLTELPESFTMLTNLQELRLDGNPLRVPPLQIVEQGKEAILQYMAENVAQKDHSQIMMTKKGKLEYLFPCFFNTFVTSYPVERGYIGVNP